MKALLKYKDKSFLVLILLLIMYNNLEHLTQVYYQIIKGNFHTDEYNR